jgi:glucuronoarabinoxylan endo-1,4-beta-xylanase
MSQFSNLCRCVSLMCMGFFPLAGAQSINITGTVADSSTSQGVSGAIVKIVEVPLITARTASNGAFTLTGTTAAFGRPSTMAGSVSEIVLNGNALRITGVRHATQVTVDVYKSDGSRITHGTIAAGANGIISCANLWQTPGAYFVKVRFDGKEYRVSSLGKNKISFSSEGETEIGSAKVSASYTLDVSAPGYLRKQIPLTVTTGSIGTIQLVRIQNTTTVYLDSALYAMDGFGACIPYDLVFVGTVASQEFLFSTKDSVSYAGSRYTGIGLTCFRIAILPDGTVPSWTWPSAKLALAVYPNIKFWGAPWSPPTQYKTTGNTKTGGMIAGSASAWADILATTFVNNAKAQGISIYAISAQNEPDIDVSNQYNMCLFNPSEFVNFIKVLGPKLHALNPPVKLMAPEPAGWYDMARYCNPIFGDAAAFAQTDIYASHSYGSSLPSQTLIPKGKVVWETECGLSGLTAQAMLIHNNITMGNVSAFHWWEFKSLVVPGSPPQKVAFVTGNYSRFIRPGNMRVYTAGTLPANVSMTAYRDSSNTPIIVAINNGSASATVTLSIFGGTAPTIVTPWVTSASENLVRKAAIAVSGGVFTATLTAQSITTFSSR